MILPYGVEIISTLNPNFTYEIPPSGGHIFPITINENQMITAKGYQLAGTQNFSLDIMVSKLPWTAPMETTYPLKEEHFAIRSVMTDYVLSDWDVAPPNPLPPSPPLGVGARTITRKYVSNGTDPNTIIWRLLTGQYYINIQNLENRTNKYYLRFY